MKYIREIIEAISTEEAVRLMARLIPDLTDNDWFSLAKRAISITLSEDKPEPSEKSRGDAEKDWATKEGWNFVYFQDIIDEFDKFDGPVEFSMGDFEYRIKDGYLWKRLIHSTKNV